LVDATWLTLVLAAGTFLAVEALLLASVLRLWRRARAAPRPEGRFPLRWGWELVWTALPAVGLLALAILSARNLF
jgi:heme/copper-type cytochrome/quinol oxidase subunit 2